MNKVITINLNGRAFLLEEGGYEKLQNYLQEARTRLGEDPDKEEIIADLEQAVAEKFSRFLAAGKTVVLEKEVDEVLKEMGPVQGSQKTDETANSSQNDSAGAPKRLYLIREGAIFGGVCTGLAAYFNADVTLIRLIFIILTLVTQGFGILVYLIMMIVIPKAKTSKEKAQAFGRPFTAQEWVDKAKQEYHNFADKGEWKKWRHEIKQQHREEKQRRRQEMYSNHGPGYIPFFGLIIGVLSVLWLLGLLSLATKGMILGYAVPAGIPIWVAVLVWLCLYSFIVWPFKAARWHWTYVQDGNIHHYHNHDGFPEAMAWFAFWAIMIWLLWHFVPDSHPYFYKVSLWWQHVWEKIKRW
ncbi:MAG: PspC domain-containing protein [Candidatus Doudnabacteria bacterium]|nr:PspC domain-containing protein [Candidatus Doudnabacteria bacterium]